MLMPREEATTRRAKARAYQDPALENTETLLHLLLRLHDAKMLVSTDRAESHLSFFAVVKKIFEGEEAQLEEDRRLRLRKKAGLKANPDLRTGTSSGSTGGPSRGSSSRTGPSQSTNGKMSTLRGAVPRNKIVIQQRLIADNQVGNCDWRVAPKIQVSSTESVCALDFSAEHLQGDAVATFQGDAPDYYYTVEIEEWMHPWFAIRGIDVPTLNAFLRSKGRAPLREGPGYLVVAVRVLIMGWSWSCWIAECILEDIMGRPGASSRPVLDYGTERLLLFFSRDRQCGSLT
jgi:hypothetical protein